VTVTQARHHDRRSFLSLLAAGALLAPAAAACAAGTGPRSADFAALAEKTGDPETGSLRYQGSSGTVLLPELAADLGYLQDLTLDWVGNTISGPQDIQSAATRQTAFGGAFNGAVAKLVAAGAPVTAVISYYGVDKYSYNGIYVREDSPIAAAADLVGKKVGMNTLGAHDEAVLDIYLQRNGLSEDRIKQVEPLVVPPVNTEESIRLGQIDAGFLGSILRDKALARGGLRALTSDYQLLGNFSAGTYVFRDDFIEAYPNTVRVFVGGVAKAIEWSRTTPIPQVVARMQEIIAKRHRDESGAAVQYFKSWGIAGTGGVVKSPEIQIWIDWLVKQGSITAGKITASQVYTNAFNPYAKAEGATP
jgi:ABC-type nitrate/sulfonate/bicarbonate transport system substrate-binding protein